jgi:DNA-binding response OmpR family regulator
METIMIQEADAATLEMLTVALQMEGYQVCSMIGYKENVLDMIRRHHPKLVLLDCWLSNYFGTEICQLIKAHFPRLPVVALSCDNQIDQHYRQFGFDDYIKKPFDLDLLYQVVRKHMRLHKKHLRIGVPA